MELLTCKIVVDGMFCNLLFNFSIPEVGMIYPSEFSCIKLSFSLVYQVVGVFTG